MIHRSQGASPDHPLMVHYSDYYNYSSTISTAGRASNELPGLVMRIASRPGDQGVTAESMAVVVQSQRSGVLTEIPLVLAHQPDIRKLQGDQERSIVSSRKNQRVPGSSPERLSRTGRLSQ